VKCVKAFIAAAPHLLGPDKGPQEAWICVDESTAQDVPGTETPAPPADPIPPPAETTPPDPTPAPTAPAVDDQVAAPAET
jgi:hypothetical protein